MTNQLIKLRLQQERLRRVMDKAADEACNARREWEVVWLQYLDEAQRCGLCRYCLKPRDEDIHQHCIGLASPVEPKPQPDQCENYPDCTICGTEGTTEPTVTHFEVNNGPVDLPCDHCGHGIGLHVGIDLPCPSILPQQMKPDTSPPTHREIFSAVHHHAAEIVRLTATVPTDCGQRTAPPPPDVLADALQDVVHTDTGAVRAGRSVRNEPKPPQWPEYTNAIGDAGYQYMQRCDGRTSSGMFYWHELWDTLNAAAYSLEHVRLGLQDVVHTDTGAVRAGRSVRNEPKPDAPQCFSEWQVAGHVYRCNKEIGHAGNCYFGDFTERTTAKAP